MRFEGAPMMEENGIRLETGTGLEEWLESHDGSVFPPLSPEKGVKPYPERYVEFKNALLPIHDKIELGAMAAGALEWMKKTEEIANAKTADKRKRLLEELRQSDPIAHLNNHGRGHVDKVIKKVSEMLHFFKDGHLTPYEGFFLLCAIQLHDTGAIYSRRF